MSGRLDKLRTQFALQLSSTLCGVTAGQWWRLLRENRFGVAPRYWPRAALITLASLSSSLHRWREERLYRKEVEAVEVKPPLFVIGHWRSGTTHLHNLLSRDECFAFPNLYQAIYPHHFLTTEKRLARLFQPLLPSTRLIDQIPADFTMPFEDEYACRNFTQKSPYLAWDFPRRADHYGRYLTFREVPAEEVARWREGLSYFLKKLTWKYARPLVLKSPTHTARIRFLLEMFPEARFVHIHRHPDEVFVSTRSMVQVASRTAALQSRDESGLDESIIRAYRELHEAFFSEKGLIPAGRYHELSYHELERDPLGQLEILYDRLSMPSFAAARPLVERYLGTLHGYRKNRHPDLPAGLRLRLRREWAPCYAAWGYD